MRVRLGTILGTALAAIVVAGCIDPYDGGRHRRGDDRTYHDRHSDEDSRAGRRSYDEDRDDDWRRYADEDRLPTLVCGSKNGRPARCRTNFRIRMRSRAELDSGSPCTYGRTWGYDRDEVWVTDGYRARFVLFPARRR